MQCPQHDTMVQAPSGEPEARRVAEVHEWRIEKELASDAVVISVITADGQSQSFLLGPADAQDIGEVLRLNTTEP